MCERDRSEERDWEIERVMKEREGEFRPLFGLRGAR
jgi:hypothetical protein